MKILNQKKDVLINFDNVVVLAIDNEKRIIYIQENHYQIILGGYQTIERLKEVFEDIIKALTISDVLIYKMPEK